MRILFLTVLDFDSLEESNIYTDLIKEFLLNSHEVFIISPSNKISNNHIINISDSCKIIKTKIIKFQKTSIFIKLLSLLTFESRIINQIKRNLKNTKFDLVIYSTPPVSFNRIINYLKKIYNLKAYLLLKDIFPQNAVDLGLIKKSGISGLVYKYFRLKEIKLYKTADYIGCMSDKNVSYILNHNNITKEKVHLNPNSIKIHSLPMIDRSDFVRNIYNIPLSKKVFIYGGNIGKPQGVSFIIEVINRLSTNSDIFNIVVGDGTEAYKLEKLFKTNKIKNFLYLNRLSTLKFDELLLACDVGMIYLDGRFTIPNFPSRILSYMKNKLPIYAITDGVSDLKEILIENDIGYWSKFGNIEHAIEVFNTIINDNLLDKGENSYNYLINNFTVEKSYKIIMGEIK
jgi:hypothetical protein